MNKRPLILFDYYLCNKIGSSWKLLLHIISEAFAPKGEVLLEVKQLTEQFNVTEKTIIHWIKKLSKNNFISEISSSNDTYRIQVKEPFIYLLSFDEDFYKYSIRDDSNKNDEIFDKMRSLEMRLVAMEESYKEFRDKFEKVALTND